MTRPIVLAALISLIAATIPAPCAVAQDLPARRGDMRGVAAMLAASKKAQAILANMYRCDAIAGEISRLAQADEASLAPVRAAAANGVGSFFLLRDRVTELTMTPNGVRRQAASVRLRACLAGGADTSPSTARTCDTLEQRIDDLTLAREQRWIGFRGPMAAVVTTKQEAREFNKAWRAKRGLFDVTDHDNPDAVKLAAAEAERARRCSAGSPPTAAGAIPSAAPQEPVW